MSRYAPLHHKIMRLKSYPKCKGSMKLSLKGSEDLQATGRTLQHPNVEGGGFLFDFPVELFICMWAKQHHLLL